MLSGKLLPATSESSLVFVGGNATSGSSGTSSVTYSLTGLTGGVDSAPSVGDIVVVAVALRNPTDVNITCTTSGYTEVADLYGNSTNDINLAAYYKVLSSAETSVTFDVGVATTSRFAVHVWRYASTASPLDTTSTTAVRNSSGVPNAPAITTVTDNAVVLAIGAAAYESSFPGTTFTAPSGMENFFTAASSSVSAIGIASVTVPTAGVYDPAAFGGGSSNTRNSSAAITLALRP